MSVRAEISQAALTHVVAQKSVGVWRKVHSQRHRISKGAFLLRFAVIFVLFGPLLAAATDLYQRITGRVGPADGKSRHRSILLLTGNAFRKVLRTKGEPLYQFIRSENDRTLFDAP